ncbi:hypothetical protein KI387_041243, partial [Taxus chinensis]
VLEEKTAGGRTAGGNLTPPETLTSSMTVQSFTTAGTRCIGATNQFPTGIRFPQ